MTGTRQTASTVRTSAPSPASNAGTSQADDFHHGTRSNTMNGENGS
mgnify:CR=1 FL=1